MTMATKNEIFKRCLKEYLQAGKPKKTEILDTVRAVTSMHRKSATPETFHKFGRNDYPRKRKVKKFQLIQLPSWLNNALKHQII